ncbi:MAG: tetraacyldisaccharide 4'-kinase [Betaproteobacteria bacterium]|nr:tetraacyldisaccharide 4'-kinase [Betaproteobacteria bacterium]
MAWIERHWQSVTPVSALLYPASLLYRAAAAARRAALSPVRLPVPVVVAGNITVGGTGKTPLTLWLAQFLAARGFTPGIVSRGYGGRSRAPRRVLPESDPAACGDEAVLLARRSGCEVWIGADRVAAARALLAAQPACDVVLSDDGLQHYRLARDLEICLVDAARGLGNGWLLPAGPLREPPSRLAEVDAVLVNGGPAAAIATGRAPRFAMRLEGREFRNVLNPEHRAGPEHFHGRRVHAVAGIGHPRRFFRHLQELGLDFTAHPFPDHHPFTASDVAFAPSEAVLMTEKDAVKCRLFATEMHWELVVDAAPDPGLGELVLERLAQASRAKNI